MTDKNKGGRPVIELTDEQIIQVESLSAVLSKEQLCDYFGIANNTFDAICDRQPEVFERYKRGKAKAIASVASNLISQARNGNMTAAIFYLKTQAGWKETQVVDNTSSDGSMSPPQDLTVEIAQSISKKLDDEY